MNIPQNWRLKQQRYNLSGTTADSGDVQFPPRPAVEQRDVEQYDLSEGVEPSDMAEAVAQPRSENVQLVA